MRCAWKKNESLYYNMKTRVLLWKWRILENALSRGVRPQTTLVIHYNMLLGYIGKLLYYDAFIPRTTRTL